MALKKIIKVLKNQLLFIFCDGGITSGDSKYPDLHIRLSDKAQWDRGGTTNLHTTTTLLFYIDAQSYAQKGGVVHQYAKKISTARLGLKLEERKSSLGNVYNPSATHG